DIDRVRAEQVAQKGNPHRFALEVVDNVLAHVASADAVIDRIVEPVVVLEHVGQRRLADARHAEDGHGLRRPLPEFSGGGKSHPSPEPNNSTGSIAYGASGGKRCSEFLGQPEIKAVARIVEEAHIGAVPGKAVLDPRRVAPDVEVSLP